MYTCNITGNEFTLDEKNKSREGSISFNYNSRFRAICYVLSVKLFGEVKILNDIESRKDIKGIGMSDSGWATICKEKFNYVNTFYHMEPFLDIYNDNHVKNYTELDFVISSDVFEHIDPYPDIQIAFNNLYAMLKKGGSLIFSVPYTHGKHVEHYPSLYDYKIEKSNDEYILHNTTIDGQKEIYRNLVFHGGPGNTLEMRIYSKDSIMHHLETAGFIDIEFHEITEDMNRYGIFFECNLSLIVSAKK